MMERRARSILVIDEQREAARTLQPILQGLGYDALTATASDEGLATVAARRPDLVLLNVRTKGKYDWRETAWILKSTFDLPAVFVGKRVDKQRVEQATNGAPHRFLTKPVKQQELHAAIEDTLQRYELERQLRSRERWLEGTVRPLSTAALGAEAPHKANDMNLQAQMRVAGPLDNGRQTSPTTQHDPLPYPTPTLPPASEAVPSSLERPLLIPLRPEASAVVEPIAGLGRSDLSEPIMVFSDINEANEGTTAKQFPDVASLGALSNRIAHDISNPLAVVLANTSLGREELALIVSELENGSAPRAATMVALRGILEMQEETLIAATRISRIVDELKVAGRVNPEGPPLCRVQKAVAWALKTAGHAVNERARVSVDVEDVDAVRLDESRLAQVLVNLLLNAEHAFPKGKHPSNEVRITASQVGDKNVRLEVSDTGVGIPKEILARIFEPFFTTKTPHQGKGLGLSICQGIVKSVDGSLTVESITGLGTKFTLTLPLAKTSRALTPAKSNDIASRPSRILVVDNEPLVARMIRRTLRGNDIVCVETARAALHLLRSGQSFDAIVCDVTLPEMNGMELYRILLQTRPSDARKLIFLAGAADPDMAAFLATVPNARLDKPFDVEQLRAVVQRVSATSESSVG